MSDDFDSKVRDFDRLNPGQDMHEDPYPFMNEVRERCPVAHSDKYGGYWMVSRYEDVRSIHYQPKVFSSNRIHVPRQDFPLGHQIPLELDPPQHAKYRRPLAPLFGPERIRALEPMIRQTAKRLIEGLGDECEFVSAVGVPLPVATFLHSFAIPESRLGELLEYKQMWSKGASHDGHSGGKVEDLGIVRFFRQLLEERRHSEGDDVISVLARSQIDGRSWTDDEIVIASIMLTLASLDTTTAGMSNAFAYLASHPEQRDRLVRDPAIIPNAVEELLRWEGITTNSRMVMQDVELHGVKIKAGDMVMFLTGAANRDPRKYECPERVDFDRKADDHLTFGAGPHSCLGKHMARATIRIAMEEFHQAFPAYRLKPGTRPERFFGKARGVRSLQLVLRG